MNIEDKYKIKTESIKSKPGCWDVLKVFIYDHKDNLLGSYNRNYPNFYNTFFPFVQDGKEYALYSSDYTSTRVMSLPDCKDLGGEERNNFGFCPVEFYVPTVKCEEDVGTEFDPKGKFGFVAGCVWGDDHSWKIQHLDLSRVSKGIVTRDARFGRIELLGNQSLKDAIDIEWWDEEDQAITITCTKRFYMGEDYNM